ncbi:MAG: hypothetical protein IKQ41_01390 [Clostridia bacterium]|nr:hypothetical protein [Clostridia bacterium]
MKNNATKAKKRRRRQTMETQARKNKKRRLQLHEVDLENDIRYRGPLSYLGLQILGWMAIVASAAALLIRIGGKLDPSVTAEFGQIGTVMTYVSALSLPCLLIANFARILNNTEKYWKQLLRNGLAMLGIYALSYFLINRYFFGLLGQFVTDPENVEPILMTFFRQMKGHGFIAFNLFVDLFLCSLFMFFLNVRPKRVFTGKKVLILRALALLPIAYEVASIWLKGMAAAGKVELPLWSFGLLTLKPPMAFLVFVILALHIKEREYRFCRHGRSQEEYHAYLQTNRNSLHFSVYLTILIVIAVVIDFIILFVFLTEEAGSLEKVEEITDYNRTIAVAMGFGEAITMFFVLPFLLLFSYTRVPKSKTFSLFVPVIAIAMIVLLFVEGFYQGVGSLGFEKTDTGTLLMLIQSGGLL